MSHSQYAAQRGVRPPLSLSLLPVVILSASDLACLSLCLCLPLLALALNAGDPIPHLSASSCLFTGFCFSLSAPNAQFSSISRLFSEICMFPSALTGSVGLVRRASGPAAVGGRAPKEGGAHGGGIGPKATS